MLGSLQTFLSTAIKRAASQLEEALDRVPADKRAWSPMGGARTALHQFAECAMLADISDMANTKAFPEDFDFAHFQAQMAQLSENEAEARAMLHQNVEKCAATILTIPDEDLAIEIPMPWGPITVAHLLAYPYWNMAYHEGQINYIAAMLGTLE